MGFNFETALGHVKNGQFVCRSGWNGKNMYMYLYLTDDRTKLQNFLAIKTADNKIIPWVISQADLLAEDWEVYDSKSKVSVPFSTRHEILDLLSCVGVHERECNRAVEFLEYALENDKKFPMPHMILPCDLGVMLFWYNTKTLSNIYI